MQGMPKINLGYGIKMRGYIMHDWNNNQKREKKFNMFSSIQEYSISRFEIISETMQRGEVFSIVPGTVI